MGSHALSRVLAVFATIGLAAATSTAGSPSAVRPAISGLAHAAFRTSDLMAARAYYTGYLGYAELSEPLSGTEGVHFASFKVNDRQQLRIRAAPNPAASRLIQIGLLTRDAGGLHRYLVSRGAVVSALLTRNRHGDRSFTMHDPDGHLLEFVEYTSQSQATRTRGQDLAATRIAPRIRHAGFLVADLAATLRFYEGLLGFAEIWRGSSDDKTLSWVNLKVPDGDEYLELMLYDPSTPPDSDRAGILNHVCLEVVDVSVAEATLRDRPLPGPCKPTSAWKIGRNGRRQINCFDPDGTRTEIMEPNTYHGAPVPSSSAPAPAAGTRTTP